MFWSRVFTTGCPSWRQLHVWDNVCKISIGSVYVGGYGGLSEEDFVSSVNCVICFLVASKGSLESVVMSYVDF